MIVMIGTARKLTATLINHSPPSGSAYALHGNYTKLNRTAQERLPINLF
tara:strand:- start:387 stop:533 length:147 start_codon:yes stop_codon:yes gene_type:complete